MQTASESFFRNTVPGYRRQLKPDQSPQWGLLNPQAMVEPLTGAWRISNGNAGIPQHTTPEQATAYKARPLSAFYRKVKHRYWPAQPPGPAHDE